MIHCDSMISNVYSMHLPRTQGITRILRSIEATALHDVKPHSLPSLAPTKDLQYLFLVNHTRLLLLLRKTIEGLQRV